MNIGLTMGWILVLGVPLRVRRAPTNAQREDNLICDRS
jgi:hypothetical protein